ncbi:MAG: DUF2269 family protein [Actinomycetota bacterium]|nr:DUF2269 family protein [Actinomycetota bacterium]
MYDLLKSIHVLAAVAWVGGALFGQILAVRARKGGPTRLAQFADDMAWLGPHYFAPISLLVLLTGIGTVIVSGWEFTDLWIVIGLLGFAATFVTGIAYLAPAGKKVTAGITDRGPEDAEVQSNIERIQRISQIDTLVLVIVVLNMVVKPGT